MCGAAMIAHLAGLSFFLQDERGLGPAAYSAVFALDAAGMIAANNLNRVLLRRVAAQRVLSVALPVMLAAAVAFAAALRWQAPLPVLLPALFAFVSCWGFVMPNAIAVGMSVERAASGRASAILGVAQFGFASFSAPLVGTVPTVAGVPPMGGVIVACLAGAVLVQLVGRSRTAAAPGQPRCLVPE
jgi:DHA1 family bicyclomycin/chloramphenicol resistance-like MFS transporter